MASARGTSVSVGGSSEGGLKEDSEDSLESSEGEAVVDRSSHYRITSLRLTGNSSS